MFNFFKIFCLYLFYSSSISFYLYAGEITFEVKKVRRRSSIGLVKHKKEFSLEKGMELIFEISKNKKCNLTIIETSKNNAIFSMKKCNFNKKIKEGTVLKYLYKSFDESGLHEYLIIGFNSKKRELTTNLPIDHSIKTGMEFNIFSTDYNYCPVKITKIVNITAYADTSTCSFEYELREGLKLELKSTISLVKKKKINRLKYESKLFYLMFNLGYPYLNYSNKYDKLSVEKYLSDSTKSHIPIAFDLLGAYFPFLKDDKLLLGFNLGFIGDFFVNFDDFGKTFQIDQFSYSASTIYFFDGIRQGYGLFLRGDIGGSKYVATRVVTEENDTVESPEKSGFGLVIGPGLRYTMGEKSSILLSTLYSYKKMSKSTIQAGLLMLGFIF